MSSEKESHPVDRHVGARVRLRRSLIGMSQEQLSTQLGLTFQQIQKYEKGTNRVSASRLWEISRILEVPVDYFFKGAALHTDCEASHADSDQLTSFADNADSLLLLRHFVQIANPGVRRAIVGLVRSLASDSESEPVDEPIALVQRMGQAAAS